MGDSDVPWFDTAAFMPHGHCYLWTPSLVAMHAGSDVLIGFAYLLIPFALYALVRRRPDLPFRGLFAAFSVFIVLCGCTHLMSAWNIWHAEYWIDGLLKVATAVASLPTAIALWRALPDLLALPSQAQLQHAIDELNNSNRELEAFVATASHDLRSPLRGTGFLLEALQRSSTSHYSEHDRRSLALVVDEIGRMSQAVDARLRLAQVAREPLAVQPIDVSALAVRIGERLALANPGSLVHYTVQPGMTAHADPALLDVLLDNLVGNAWKFTLYAEQPSVQVGGRRLADRTQHYVRDNGVGFDMREAHKLFRPMQRLHSPARYPGNGLGLATAARIVERHGGSIRIESEPGVGTTVTFELPTAVAQTARGRRADADAYAGLARETASDRLAP